jgi:hypothetical protein
MANAKKLASEQPSDVTREVQTSVEHLPPLTGVWLETSKIYSRGGLVDRVDRFVTGPLPVRAR